MEVGCEHGHSGWRFWSFCGFSIFFWGLFMVMAMAFEVRGPGWYGTAREAAEATPVQVFKMPIS